jgi:hypothetical protein
MALDPSIALGFRQPEAPNQLNMLANALNIKGAMQQQQMGAMQMEQERAKVGQQNALRNFLSTTDVRTPDGLNALRKAFPLEASKIELDMLEPDIKRNTLDKGKIDNAAAQFRFKQEQIGVNLQRLASVTNPQQAEQWIKGGINSGLLDMRQASQAIAEMQAAAASGPQGFADWRNRQQMEGMSLSQQMEQQWKAKDFGLNVQKFEETKRSNRVQEGISAGNLGVARGNLGLRKQELEAGGGAGKAPAGYRWGAGGSLEFIPGGPADPANKRGGEPTEDEKRSAGLAVRMEAALKKVGEVTATNKGAAKPEVTAEILRGVPMIGEPLANVATSEDRQRVDTAQIDALDAALTLATGAAYTKEQLRGLAKSYFPQIGDDTKTVADKEERLRTVIESARIRAGRSSGAIDAALGAGKQPGVPAVGTVQGGYRFKGGNPADQNNWEKQ